MYTKLERGGSKQDIQKEDAKENIFLYVISPKLNIYNFFLSITSLIVWLTSVSLTTDCKDFYLQQSAWFLSKKKR